jgi:hypothetical protein
MSKLKIECPECETAYTPERAGLTGEPGLPFTIICTVCGNAFNGEFEITDAKVASRLNRFTFGWFGTPAVETATIVKTRKRQ